ncbi:hypothetical protein HanRHA438_Chr06g0280371 [Helianthus annuus]|nr:hypothetical protein HanIR_Chr06g0291391 [Helianthus annuus]KAJ0912980.1 hypothetical protein HanRHA438_Chr06g0280371 [Helianthus annuus]
MCLYNGGSMDSMRIFLTTCPSVHFQQCVDTYLIAATISLTQGTSSGFLYF